MHTRIHIHTTCLFHTHSLFIAASGRCVIYISLSLRLWRAQLCGCILATHVFVFVFFFLFLLMHQVVFSDISYRALNSHLNHVEALCWKCSHSWSPSPEADRSVLLRLRQFFPVDIWMESFRSCILKRWCKIHTWGNRWLKWNGILAVLSQIVHHELERSDRIMIFPMQGLLWATVWGLFVIYCSDSAIEALLPNGGLSHGVLA